MQKEQALFRIFAKGVRNKLRSAELNLDLLQEIRLRSGGPLILSLAGREFFLTNSGNLSAEPSEAYIVEKKEIQETMEYIGSYSLYAFEEELKQGFLTIQGGHRVGVAGKVVLDKDQVKTMKYISCINVRLSHQVKGCADAVLPYIWEGNQLCHTLIVSPPRCGKTTLLRDLIRQISDGGKARRGMTVAVVDERSEIAGSYMGVPQNDLGIRTDVLDCCPKAEGMMMMIRSMSPQVVCVDEIGDKKDMQAIESVIHCGSRVVATIHGTSMEDVRQKPLMQALVKERVFQRYIVLHNSRGKDGKIRMGRVQAVYDERGTALYREMEGGIGC